MPAKASRTMPFTPRQNGSRKSSKGSEEEYVVFLQGIPPQCRWQELKDLVRQTAHHIRQAVVYDDCHGRPTGLGQIIVKNEDEAWRTYNRLSTNGWDGNPLTVTLSLARAPTRPIAGPTRSPPLMRRYPSYNRGYPSPPTTTNNISTPSPSTSPEKHIMSPQSCAWLPEYNPFITNFAPGYQPLAHDTNSPIAYVVPVPFNNKGHMPLPTPPAHPAELENYSHQAFLYTAPRVQPAHEVHTNNTGSKTHHYGNIRSCNSSVSDRSNRSSISTGSSESIQPCCNILVENLKPNTTWQNLRDYLRPAGVVQRCEVYNNFQSGRPSSGTTGKVTFRSPEEAQKAVRLFDCSYSWGSKIRVSLEEASTISDYPAGHVKNSRKASVNAEHDLLAASMNGLTMDSVEGDKKAKANEPLVVNGSSVGAKANTLCPRDPHPTDHLVRDSPTVRSH